MVGNSAASLLAHLHPELALLCAPGLDQRFLIPALNAARWEGRRAASLHRRSGHRRGLWRYEDQVSGGQAWPWRLHTISTRFPRPAFHSACVVIAGGRPSGAAGERRVVSGGIMRARWLVAGGAVVLCPADRAAVHHLRSAFRQLR